MSNNNNKKNKYLNFVEFDHYLQLISHEKSLYKLVFLMITSLFSTIALYRVDAKVKPLFVDTNKYLIEIFEGGLFLLIIFLPFIYIFRNELHLIFKKPSWNHYKISFKWAFLVLSAVFAILLIIYYFLPINLKSNNAFSGEISVLFIRIIRMILQILGEHLMFVSIFIVFYKIIRIFIFKSSTLIITAIMLASISFGLLHLPTYGFNLLHCVFLIGIPATTHLIISIKYQNILMGYFIHLNYDLMILTFSILSIIQRNPAL